MSPAGRSEPPPASAPRSTVRDHDAERWLRRCLFEVVPRAHQGAVRHLERWLELATERNFALVAFEAGVEAGTMEAAAAVWREGDENSWRFVAGGPNREQLQQRAQLYREVQKRALAALEGKVVG